MTGNTFDDLLSEVDEIGGEFALDELMNGSEGPCGSDLEFEDDLTGNARPGTVVVPGRLR